MTLEKKLGLAFAGALAVLVALSVIPLLSLRSLHRTTRRVADSRAILSQIERLLAQAREVEFCMRSFVVTGEEAFLKRHGGCEADVDPALGELKRLVAGRPGQFHRVRRIDPLIRRRLALAHEAVAARRREGVAAASRLIVAGRSEQHLESLLRLEAEVRAEEEGFVRLWLEERQANLEQTFRFLGLGGIFSVLLLSAAGWRLRQDLRQRRRLERELADFFAMSVDLLSISNFEGRFTRLSPSWERVLGWSLEELMSKPFVEFVHPDDRAKTADETCRLSEGRATVDFENRYLCRDGTYRWLSWSAAVDRESRLFLAVARDATAQKEAQRLREELAHHVNHDLRSPAATLEMTAKVLLAGDLGKPPEGMRPFLESLLRNAQHLGRMIEDLLDVVRSETGKLAVQPVETDLGEIVRETASAFEPLAREKDLSLSASVEAGLPSALADPARVRQVLTNLIDNAIKFTPKGGRVTVRTAPAPSAPGFLSVSVSDTGRGIPAAHRERVFERHFQVPGTKGRGLGLGLTICRDLVSQQGGRIWVESEEREGTTVLFTVPAAKGT